MDSVQTSRPEEFQIRMEQDLGPSNYFIEQARNLFDIECDRSFPSHRSENYNYNQYSELMRLGADFELRLGNIDTAVYYASRGITTADKIILFKTAMELGEIYMAASLGDLETELESQRSTSGLFDYYLMLAGLGISPHLHLDQAEVLATDPGLRVYNRDGDTTEHLAMAEIAITARGQGIDDVADRIYHQYQAKFFKPELGNTLLAAKWAKQLEIGQLTENRWLRGQVKRLGELKPKQGYAVRPLEMLALAGCTAASDRLKSTSVWDFTTRNPESLARLAGRIFLADYINKALSSENQHISHRTAVAIASHNYSKDDYTQGLLSNFYASVMDPKKFSPRDRMEMLMQLGLHTVPNGNLDVKSIDSSEHEYSQAIGKLEALIPEIETRQKTDYSLVDRSRTVQFLQPRFHGISHGINGITNPYLAFDAFARYLDALDSAKFDVVGRVKELSAIANKCLVSGLASPLATIINPTLRRFNQPSLKEFEVYEAAPIDEEA